MNLIGNASNDARGVHNHNNNQPMVGNDLEMSFVLMDKGRGLIEDAKAATEKNYPDLFKRAAELKTDFSKKYKEGKVSSSELKLSLKNLAELEYNATNLAYDAEKLYFKPNGIIVSETNSIARKSNTQEVVENSPRSIENLAVFAQSLAKEALNFSFEDKIEVVNLINSAVIKLNGLTIQYNKEGKKFNEDATTFTANILKNLQKQLMAHLEAYQAAPIKQLADRIIETSKDNDLDGILHRLESFGVLTPSDKRQLPTDSSNYIENLYSALANPLNNLEPAQKTVLLAMVIQKEQSLSKGESEQAKVDFTDQIVNLVAIIEKPSKNPLAFNDPVGTKKEFTDACEIVFKGFTSKVKEWETAKTKQLENEMKLAIENPKLEHTKLEDAAAVATKIAGGFFKGLDYVGQNVPEKVPPNLGAAINFVPGGAHFVTFLDTAFWGVHLLRGVKENKPEAVKELNEVVLKNKIESNITAFNDKVLSSLDKTKVEEYKNELAEMSGQIKMLPAAEQQALFNNLENARKILDLKLQTP